MIVAGAGTVHLAYHRAGAAADDGQAKPSANRFNYHNRLSLRFVGAP